MLATHIFKSKNFTPLHWRFATRSMGFGSHVSDNDPEVIEAQKQANLQGKTKSPVKNAEGWNEQLASDSEAVVKAEREPDEPVAQMQKETIQYLEADK